MRLNFLAMAALMAMSVGGCSREAPAPSAPAAGAGVSQAEAEITEAIAKLPAEEQPLAKAQKFCAVLPENRLGSMGMPKKVMLENQPVFLCCEACEEKALANPKETLAKAVELRGGK